MDAISAPLTRQATTSLERIISPLRTATNGRLWSFPIKFIDRGGGHFDKIPCVAWKDFQTRPPTIDVLRCWYNVYGRARGAAIPTGRATRLLVVDADSADAIEWLELRGMPATVCVRTRRGLQYWCDYPEDWPDIHNSAGEVGLGIDIRAIGGMVVALGSNYDHEADEGSQTFTYHFDEGASPADVPFAPPPTWLLSWFRAQQEKRQPPLRRHGHIRVRPALGP